MRTNACAAMLILLSACSGAAEPVDTGRLVVTGAGGSVSLVDPVSGDREVVAEASRPGLPVQPTPSPDGTVLVWSEVDDDGRAAVAVAVDGGIDRIPVPTLPFYYQFSPDGQRLAMLGNDPDGAGVALLTLSLPADPPVLVEVGTPYYLDWHPDGLSLAVHIGTDFLGTLGVDGTRVASGVRPGPFLAPQWTSAGEIVAVIAADDITAALVSLQAPALKLAVVDPADGSVGVIADVSELTAFEVSGDRVAYVQGAGGAGPLTVVGLDGAGPVEVAPADVVAFEWSPDGSALLFHTLDRDGPVLVPHVWDGAEVTDYPAFTPTARFLAEYLPFWSQYIRTITQWAPDSGAFAYAAMVDEVATVHVQPLRGEPADLGGGEMVIWSP